MAVIALMEREFVQKRKLLSVEEFLHGVGFGQVLGSFAVNSRLLHRLSSLRGGGRIPLSRRLPGAVAGGGDRALRLLLPLPRHPGAAGRRQRPRAGGHRADSGCRIFAGAQGGAHSAGHRHRGRGAGGRRAQSECRVDPADGWNRGTPASPPGRAGAVRIRSADGRQRPAAANPRRHRPGQTARYDGADLCQDRPGLFRRRFRAHPRPASPPGGRTGLAEYARVSRWGRDQQPHARADRRAGDLCRLSSGGRFRRAGGHLRPAGSGRRF